MHGRLEPFVSQSGKGDFVGRDVDGSRDMPEEQRAAGLVPVGVCLSPLFVTCMWDKVDLPFSGLVDSEKDKAKSLCLCGPAALWFAFEKQKVFIW